MSPLPPPKTGGRPGTLFPWAGNISHWLDPGTEIPNLEDEKIKSSKWVEDFAERLKRLRDDDARTFADDGAVQYSERALNVQVKDLHVCGLAMRRYKYKSIDCFAENPYKCSAQAQRYDSLTSKGTDKTPRKELVQWMMAKILLKHNRKLGGRVKNLMKTAYVKASKQLRESRSSWPAMEKELQEDAENKDLQKWWALTKAKNINQFKDHYSQCDRDSAAAADSTILEMVADQDLVLVLDKNNELIAFCASKAVQKLFSEKVLEYIYTCFDIYTYHQAIPTPDPTRHPLQAEFLRENPKYDCRAAEDRDLAKCGVEHYGCREMIGDPHGKHIYPTKGNSIRYWRSDMITTQIYPKLQRGPWRVLTEVASFFFKPLMPALREPFTLRALLVNLSTEDHTDSKDCRYGIAALTPFGNFEGADLVLRQLGLQISYPAGSVVLIRGHELAHSTTQWTKESRFVGVQTSHEATREHAYRKLGRPYPPLALAPNFYPKTAKIGKVDVVEKASMPSVSHNPSPGSANVFAGSTISSKPGCPDSEDNEDGEVQQDAVKTLLDDNGDDDGTRSHYSSDTDISCRDCKAQEDYPDMEVFDMDDRDYMTFAYEEDPTGPRYYKLASHKRKRSESSSEDEEDTSSDE
ncbi:hypothetical protein EPUS_02369 [Endocarpon pusillum Z07020]|uniref:Uncharacterized protein n=1 Tax=Endocarpon pusillum (strain Z07020 / HMAS-L-300199) TaxID=1263415 RepID=U1G0V1_ENDPU|nr:uncharacterized protein EPUS_02369 [Endocarpon pusillum Z07020]ERF70847.1 hypothetical protein EPUS_02369 [Endocarpon pusillum Z07020]